MEIPYNVPPSVTAGSVMRVTVTPTIRLLKLHVNWPGGQASIPSLGTMYGFCCMANV